MPICDQIPHKAPVLIIGGGPVGMTCALLLEQQGVDSLIVERTDALPATPRAHVIRRRSMEIFEKVGLADEIVAAVPGPETRHVTWVAQLAGREIGRLDLIKDGIETSWTNLPQNLLCPILLDRVNKSERAHITLHTDCLEIDSNAEGVTAKLKRSGQTIEVQSRWLIAADGANSLTRERLGIEMMGPEDLAQFYMVHFRADLTKWVEARPSPLFWILNPEASGTLIVHELEKSHVLMVPAKGDELSEEELSTYVGQALGVEFPIEILNSGLWTANSQIAASYRSHRAFLAGDAAHRFPPTGGLGLNTGILDAHNLAWKLAMVERGVADDALLDSYDLECRPVATKNAEASVHNMGSLIEVYKALGPFKTLADLETRLRSLNEDERNLLQAAIDNQLDHFVSDGILPGAWTGEAHPELSLPPSYDAFRLIVDSPAEWVQVVEDLERRYNVRIETVRRSQIPDARGLLRGDEAILLRPDDQWAGRGATHEELAEALNDTLIGPNKLTK